MNDLFGFEAGEPGEATPLKRAPLVLVEQPRPRGKHYVEPRGYAAMPGTGPAGLKCKDCQFYTSRRVSAGSYPKCGRMKATWTGGRASDILANAPACSRYAAPDSGVMDGSNRTTGGWIGQP